MPTPRPSRILQWPFVGLTVLLAILIFVTPFFLSRGAPTAGSPETQAILVVDRVPASNVTHFYVKGLGNVRYDSIRLGFAAPISWPAPSSASSLRWQAWVVQNESLVLSAGTTSDPVGVNVSAVYTDSAGMRVDFIALYAFHFASGYLYVAPLISGLPPSDPVPLSNLPWDFALVVSSAAGPP